jgi:hypothetical protein
VLSLPDAILDRMIRASKNAEATPRQKNSDCARNAAQVRGLVQGAQVAAPLKRYSYTIDVLNSIGSARQQLKVKLQAMRPEIGLLTTKLKRCAFGIVRLKNGIHAQIGLER